MLYIFHSENRCKQILSFFCHPPISLKQFSYSFVTQRPAPYLVFCSWYIWKKMLIVCLYVFGHLVHKFFFCLPYSQPTFVLPELVLFCIHIDWGTLPLFKSSLMPFMAFLILYNYSENWGIFPVHQKVKVFKFTTKHFLPLFFWPQVSVSQSLNLSGICWLTPINSLSPSI